MTRLPVVRSRSTAAPVVLALLWMNMPATLGAAPAEQQPARTVTITGITIAARGSAVVVTIEATGAIPPPTSGVVEAPPRIYVDFHGVALKAPRVTASADPRIRRIRAGVHSATPLVTRVVLDLAALQQYRLEHGDGRVSVIVGGVREPVSAGIAPVPALPDPSPPSSRVIGESPRTPVAAPLSMPREHEPPAVPLPPVPDRAVTPAPAPAPAPNRPSRKAAAPARSATRSAPGLAPSRSDLEQYRRQVSAALDRLRLQQPLLTALDAAEEQTADRVQLAEEEFERLRQELSGIKPPETLRSQHDLLIQSTTLALMATRLRLEALRTSDPATLRNAASAAAGATLLLDRACADLGCPDSGR